MNEVQGGGLRMGMANRGFRSPFAICRLTVFGDGPESAAPAEARHHFGAFP